MKVVRGLLYCTLTVGVLVMIAGFFMPAEWSVQQQHYIASPPAAVYSELSCLKNRTHWEQRFCTDKSLIATYNSIASGKGASCFWKSDNNGSGTATVTACQENRWLKEEWLLSGKQKVEITYTLQPAEGGTWLKTTFRTSTNGLLSKLMAYAWVKPTVKRHLKQNAIRLQTYLNTTKKTGFLYKKDIMSCFL